MNKVKKIKYKLGTKRIHNTINSKWRPNGWNREDEIFLNNYLNPSYGCHNLIKYAEFKNKYNVNDIILHSNI